MFENARVGLLFAGSSSLSEIFSTDAAFDEDMSE